MLRRTFALAAVVAVVAWAMPASAEDPKPGTHEGKVVKVEAGKLTMSDKDGKNEHTHVVPADAKVTLDGKAARLTDLKPGTPIKVTLEKKEEKVVLVRIEAKKAE